MQLRASFWAKQQQSYALTLLDAAEQKENNLLTKFIRINPESAIIEELPIHGQRASSLQL